VPVPSAVLPFFSSNARSRGETYFYEGRVHVGSTTDTRIEATVIGSERYDVSIACQGDPHARLHTVEVSCTCPHFEGGADTCKHMFAVLMAASEEPNAFLKVLETARRNQVEIVPDFDAPALETSDDDFTSDDRADMAARMREYWARRRPTGPSPSPTAPVPTSGKRFLKNLRADLGQTTVTPHAYRYAPDELIYVLDISDIARRGVQIEILARKRKKDGHWGVPMRAQISAADLLAAPVDDADIIATLLGSNSAAVADAPGYSAYGGYYQVNTTFALPTLTARLLLPRIVQTGRAFVRHIARDTAHLQHVTWDDGPPWRFAFTADPHDGALVLGGHFEREGETLPPETPVTVLDSGFLITPTTIARAVRPELRALFSRVRTHGSVELSQDDVTSLATLLAQAGASTSELPASLRAPEVDVAPQPRLSIRPMRAWTLRDHLEAAISFDYDGTIVEADERGSTWDAAKKRVIRRRPLDEHVALERARSAGVTVRFHPYSRRNVHVVPTKTMPAAVRALVAQGWRVDAEGKLMQRPSRVSMSVASGIDWFDLSANVEFAGESVPLTDILAALKKGESTIQLGGGTVGLLPEEWLERYAPLAALGQVDQDRLRFRLPQTLLLDALLEAQADETTVTIDKKFESAREQLSRFDRIAPAIPAASFRGTLRPYQKDGLGWLTFLRQFGFGGCLADDMGLGKTVMVLAMLDVLRQSRPAGEPALPALVVAPRSLVHNWMAEAARFTPELRVRDCSHASRKAAPGLWDDVDLALATYGTLRRDIDELKDREFEYVILDEAQAIKNAGTASAKASRLLRGRHRLALSGTPIENHLGELWSLFEFLNPALLGRSSVFAGVGSTTRTVDPETAQLLSRGLRPFILRRTKAQVATDLPPKTEQTIVCELEGKQRTLYNSLRAHYRDALLGRIDRVGLKKSKLQVLEALLRLRQAACHPGLIDRGHAKVSSAKLDVLVPQLREVVDEGHKALVFSQFTSFLAYVRESLDAEHIAYEYLDGQTRDREARVTRFQTDPACPVFLVSLKAGGLGLNLTAAEYVFLLDPWWNPAVEAQAIDRAHRIGQTEHVFAYRLIARDTVEEKVLELQQTKRTLADAILRADAGLVAQLGREDLELLLS
jgi:superfamily II DNA or RNA helicase